MFCRAELLESLVKENTKKGKSSKSKQQEKKTSQKGRKGRSGKREATIFQDLDSRDAHHGWPRAKLSIWTRPHQQQVGANAESYTIRMEAITHENLWAATIQRPDSKARKP